MQFRIANTFNKSLTKLNNQEQKAVKMTAFDLQVDPANPGMQLHRIERCKDPNFWSIRVNRDVRMIVHKTGNNMMLCYVDHHDDAYAWAERRRIERHPKTGAAQIVEVREVVEEAPAASIEPMTDAAPAEPPLFAGIGDERLLNIGVPEDWLPEVRRVTEDSLFDLEDHLPQEAMEGLLELAVARPQPEPSGIQPYIEPAPLADAIPEQLPASEVPPLDAVAFEHPDAQRRFQTIDSKETLERALDYPWEQWAIFLHPEQRKYVEQDYDGPARISGSAGTGKTIVALHRAVTLARRNPEANVVVTTFSPALSNSLKEKLKLLIGNEPDVHDRIFVYPVSGIGLETYKRFYGEPKIANEDQIRSLLHEAAQRNGVTNFTPGFLYSEWRDVVDAWQVSSREAYLETPRLGRKTRIGAQQREALWNIFSEVRAELAKRELVTWSEIFNRATEKLEPLKETLFDFVIVDEAQDVGVAELRFLAALGAKRTNGLFFVGDMGQRIFQEPFSWAALGVDVRGRSHTLRINYRTSKEIRTQADRLLPQSISDVDGIEAKRDDTISILNGPSAVIRTVDDKQAEIEDVADWLKARSAEGIAPNEIGVFVRTEDQLDRATAAIRSAGLHSVELSATVGSKADHVAFGTMHTAKGLEFRAVAVMACDDEVLPLQSRIEAVSDPSDLEEVYNTERHLLYVACTRARDHLLVTGVEPASEFLDDLTL